MSNDFENNDKPEEVSLESESSEQKEVQPVILEELTEDKKSNVSLEDIEKLGDINLPVRVVFANIEKTFEEVLKFSEGDTVKLNRFAGEPVDIMVKERVFAKGEITVVDDCFGVRIVDILPSGERIAPSQNEDK
ncbi:FliM/FliN family flagellar motor switch protein [Bacillus mexicanus]|uniref:FliM/FliN family flagellar motor switch protein n=1 Tax=Bacillus mexicanus TaxID=2834415 RepID=UPI003D1D36C1